MSRECSLCGCVKDAGGRLATVPTRGVWVAHESCLQGCPDNGKSIRVNPVSAEGSRER